MNSFKMTVLDGKDTHAVEIVDANTLSLSDKQELLKVHPSLKFKIDQASEIEDTITLGQGITSCVSLGRYKTHSDSNYIYVAIKTIHSDEILTKNDALSNTKEEIKEATRINRKNVESWLDKEIVLQRKIKEISQNKFYQNNLALFIGVGEDNLTKEKHYILPLAALGDGNEFIQVMNEAMLGYAERENLVKYITLKLIKIVADLNDNNLYLGDIKPGNLLFDSKGNLLFSDFNSAVFIDVKSFQHIATAPISDESYQHPFMKFVDKSKLKLEDKIHFKKMSDRWALALTLLQLWSACEADGDMNDFIKTEYLSGKDLKFQTQEEMIKVYNEKFAELAEQSAFKNMPEQFKNLIKQMLVLDINYKQMSLNELLANTIDPDTTKAVVNDEEAVKQNIVKSFQPIVPITPCAAPPIESGYGAIKVSGVTPISTPSTSPIKEISNTNIDIRNIPTRLKRSLFQDLPIPPQESTIIMDESVESDDESMEKNRKRTLSNDCVVDPNVQSPRKYLK